MLSILNELSPTVKLHHSLSQGNSTAQSYITYCIIYAQIIYTQICVYINILKLSSISPQSVENSLTFSTANAFGSWKFRIAD